MIKFSKHVTRGFIEFKNKTSLIFHVIGCNLKCYQCFNYDTLIASPDGEMTKQEVLKQIQLNGYMFDFIIFSGGEFLLYDLKELKLFLQSVRQIYNGKIIAYTNGMFPEKIEVLLEKNFLDGVHTDMKLPYHLIDIQNDKELIVKTLGVELSQQDVQKLLKSTSLTVELDSGFNQLRSVRYPFIDNSAFVENEKYIDKLNQKYSKNTSYKINQFLDERTW